MPNYKYSDYLKMFKEKITNTADDLRIVEDYLASVGSKWKRSSKNVPRKEYFYDHYRKITGRSLSSWREPQQPPQQPARIKAALPASPQPQQQPPSPPPPSQPQSPSQPQQPPEPEQQPQEVRESNDLRIDTEHVKEGSAQSAPQEQAVTRPPEGDDGKNSEMLIKSGKKIKIALGKVGIIIADFEGYVYRKWRLRPLTEDERAETATAVGDMIDNRIEMASKYGDLINVALVIGSHTASRIAEARLDSQNRQAGQGEAADPLRPLPIDQKTGQVLWNG